MGDGAGRIGAGQSNDPRDNCRGDRRSSRLAGLVMKQAVDAFFGEAPLPTPDRRTADAGAARHFEHRQSFVGKKHNFCAQNVLERAVAITGDLLKAFAVGGVQKDTDCLGHGPRLARFADFLNPMSVSMH
jgi:hypothetical protein